jgi:hypothetical protein
MREGSDAIMEQRCPKCGLFTLPTATICDCGWDFAAGKLQSGAAHAESEKYTRYAQRGWLYPVIGWVSQIILTLSLRGISGLAALWLLAAVVQFVLIVAGFYFGLKASMAGRAYLSPGQRGAAMVGVILSGGTIILITVLAVCESM